jgi:hypothetical protein
MPAGDFLGPDEFLARRETLPYGRNDNPHGDAGSDERIANSRSRSRGRRRPAPRIGPRLSARASHSVVSVTCRSPDQAHVRAVLLQGLATGGLTLRRLENIRSGGATRVVVTALLTAHSRVAADVERIVGRLSLEPTVSAVLAGRTR